MLYRNEDYNSISYFPICNDNVQFMTMFFKVMLEEEVTMLEEEVTIFCIICIFNMCFMIFILFSVYSD